jgi:chromosome segregation ATPase
MIKRFFENLILAAIVLMILSSPANAEPSKPLTLDQKIYEISSLQVSLIDKIDQAMEMRTALQQQLNELRDEIRAEQIHSSIASHQEALQNLRIRYNLYLIQHLKAYLNRLDERIEYFQTGKTRLKFLIDQIKDDIAIINTLKDMEIEKLLAHIDRVLDEYIPETKKQIFDAADIHFTPIGRVWEEIRMESG